MNRQLRKGAEDKLPHVEHFNENKNFTANLKDDILYKKDRKNVIYSLRTEMANMIHDIYLSKGSFIEPHYHINGTELIYCIEGTLHVTLINPQTNNLDTLIIKKGDTTVIPQGSFHFLRAEENCTHILAIYNTNNIETIYLSQLTQFISSDLTSLKLEKSSTTKEPYIIGPENKKKAVKKKDNEVKDYINMIEKDKKKKVDSNQYYLTSRILPYNEKEIKEEEQDTVHIEQEERSTTDMTEQYIQVPFYYSPYYCQCCAYFNQLYMR